ncbi:T9SS type A sorting domain-containing protein [bacterium]|nr:T9SS type A sorting domain-containing protein [bacterium]
MSGEIAWVYSDSLEPAAFVSVAREKFYSSGGGTGDTILRLGCWRTEYDGESGQAVAISESLGVVMLGTWGGWHPGLYFIRLSDIEAGDYTAEPILKIDGSVIDLWVEDDTLLYVHKLAGLYLFSIAHLPDIDTLAYYLNSLQSEILVEGRYIYAIMQTGRVFNIFEVDSTLGIQGKLERSDKLEIYPNPIVFGSKLCLMGLDEVRGEVIDIRGEVVKRIDGNEVDVSDLPSGIYLLNLNYRGKRIVKKLLLLGN